MPPRSGLGLFLSPFFPLPTSHNPFPSLPSPLLSTYTSFSTPEHTQDAPSCEEMSGVYHPPPSFPNMHTSTHEAQGHPAHAHTDTPTHTRIRRRLNTHAHALLIHNGGNVISQRVCSIDFCFSLLLIGSAFGTVWLFRKNPQQHHGLKRLHYLGSRET